MLGTVEEHRRQGIATHLVKWGTDQADKSGLETYVDASEEGRPYYISRHGFGNARKVHIRARPAYGHYHEVSLLRQPQ